MATLADDIVSVRWDLSPRVVYIAAAQDEITMQDLHDTLREREQRPENLIYPKLVSSAGKESLGGGVVVGITTTLQNARLAFVANKSWAQTGTVTTPDTTGRVLTDSAATFQTNLVVPGSWVINLTDGSICSVLTVDSETQLTTDILGAGSDNQWDSADAYRIILVDQKQAQGGNLVAVDDVQAELAAILPTAGNQVVRTASSSATLQELQDIQFSSFNGAVEVDLINGVSGTAYPIGTPRLRSGDLTDALSIASVRGFTRLRIIGDATIDSGLDYTGFTIEGESQTKSTITVSAAANVTNSEFENATVTGTLDGGSALRDCRITTLNYVDGFVESCILDGTITLSGTADAHFLNCWGGVTGSTIDVGSGANLVVRNYNGIMTLTNKTGTDTVSMDLNSGVITIDSGCIAGVIEIRGIGKVTDNSNGSTVDISNLVRGGDIITMFDRVQDVWKRLGLDATDAFSYDYVKREFRTASGDIVIQITGDGADFAQEVRQ